MSDATAKVKLITERRAIRAWILRDSLHGGGIGRGGAYQSGDRRTGKTLMKVVVNATPLLGLVLINRLELLPALFDEVVRH